MSNTLIVRIDPSSLANIDCKKKFSLTNLAGYTSKIPSHTLEWGSAFHKFAATWKQSGDSTKAMQAGMDYLLNSSSNSGSDFRNMSLLGIAMNEYIKEYKYDNFEVLKINDHVAIELPFKFPYKSYSAVNYIDDNPANEYIHVQPAQIKSFTHTDGKTYDQIDIIICGVIDALGKIYNSIAFKDIKTTSMYYSDSYFNNYATSIQMMIYSWVLRKLNLVDYYPGCIIDGVFLKRPSSVVCKRSSLIEFRADLIEEMELWLSDTCDNLVRAIVSNTYHKNFTKCETKFGMCELHNHCTAQPAFASDILSNNYKQRTYDPATFGQQE